MAPRDDEAAERPFFFGRQFFRINSFPKPKNYAIASSSSEKGRPVARRVSARRRMNGKIHSINAFKTPQPAPRVESG
jgi:hypothetical protein